MKLLSCAVLTLVALVAPQAGIAQTIARADLVGTWSGVETSSYQAKTAGGPFSLSWELVMGADSTYTETVTQAAGNPKTPPIKEVRSGHWTLAGDTLTLEKYSLKQDRRCLIKLRDQGQKFEVWDLGIPSSGIPPFKPDTTKRSDMTYERVRTQKP